MPADKELKPCPFCGSSVVMSENFDPNDTIRPLYDILCRNDLCYFFGEGAIVGTTRGVKSKNELFKQWNRRAVSATAHNVQTNEATK